jgi:oligopeptide transport system substrate-binding protein
METLRTCPANCADSRGSDPVQTKSAPSREIPGKKMPGFRWLVSLALLANAFLAGCGRTETPVEIGNRTQVLHRSVGQDLKDLDPHLATAAADYHVLSALFEGLVAEDPVDLHPVPGVAASWDITDAGLTYTFHLRPDARWSNGDPVTSQDFAQSFKRVLTPALAAPNAPALYLIRGAEEFHKGRDTEFAKVGILTPDARTLRLTLTHASASFLAQLNQAVWFPVHLPSIEKNGSATDRANAWARPGKLVGNGPFKLEAWRTGQVIVAAKSPTYWDAATVRLNGIQFHTLEGVDVEERAFRAGQLHMTDALPAGKIDTYQKESPEQLRIDPLLNTYFYRLNTAKPALRSAPVRRALALGIDRNAIVEKILRGGQLPARAFTPPGTAGYTFPLTATDHAAEVAAARKLLADAGFPEGRGLPPIELLYNTSENHRLIAEAIQEMWRRDLGVEVRLANQEFNSTLEARRTGAYDILRSSWSADYADPASFLDIFRSDSGNNFTGWSSPEYDAALTAAARAATAAERNALFQKAEALLLDAAPIIPIYHYTHVFVIRPEVKGWRPTLLDHHPYKAVWLETR